MGSMDVQPGVTNTQRRGPPILRGAAPAVGSARVVRLQPSMTIGTKPAADRSVDASLVHALLREQHPDLAHLVPVKVSEGWDNAVFRLGDSWLDPFASSRRVCAADRARATLAAAVVLRLPVPVPVPVRVGVPGGIFGWSWSVVRWLPGESLLHAAVPDPVATGAALAHFCRALHQPAPVDAPRNPWRGVPLDARTAALHQHLQQLDGVVNRAAVLGLWERALAAPPWSGPPLWLHGDLHPGNLLVSDGPHQA